MRRAILAGAVPYPNSPPRAPGSLGAYVWAKAFDQAEHKVVADLQCFYQRAKEPFIFLAMTPLDARKVLCMHCADTFRSYFGMGTEALNGKAMIFDRDVVNGHLPVLFAVE
eukprot:4728875-Ditylum_brightwellii.AAC.1